MKPPKRWKAWRRQVKRELKQEHRRKRRMMSWATAILTWMEREDR